jgi:crotonobetainyl-CoA:carnitine CoA-transferase CaiB-like acyl-CoA transferase
VQAGVLANQAMNYLVSGVAPRRMGNAHPNIVPYQVFPVRDGHVVIAVGNDAQFARLAAVLGAPGLAGDPRFASNAGRVAERETLVAAIAARTGCFARAELLSALEAAGVPAGPINTVADVFADPQVRARGLQIDRESGPGVRSPIVIDGVGAAAPAGVPRLGAHQEEVTDETFWSDAGRVGAGRDPAADGRGAGAAARAGAGGEPAL